MPLPPPGSVQDRLAREVVFRERQEKVAFVRALSRLVGSMNGLDSDRVFGPVVGDYAFEVFQETYDADLLARKAAALRQAAGRVKAKKESDRRMIRRLESMGRYYDNEPAKKL